MIEIKYKRFDPVSREYRFVITYEIGKYYIFKEGTDRFIHIFIVEDIDTNDLNYFIGRRVVIECDNIKGVNKNKWPSGGVSYASEGERCFILEDTEAVLFEIVGPIQFLRMNNLLPYEQ